MLFVVQSLHCVQYNTQVKDVIRINRILCWFALINWWSLDKSSYGTINMTQQRFGNVGFDTINDKVIKDTLDAAERVRNAALKKETEDSANQGEAFAYQYL